MGRENMQPPPLRGDVTVRQVQKCMLGLVVLCGTAYGYS